MKMWRGILVGMWLSIGFLCGVAYTDSLADQRAIAIATKLLKEHADSIPTCRQPPLPNTDKLWDVFGFKGDGKTKL